MKKAFAAVIASVLAFCALLNGCSVELRSIDSLMRPPHTATEAALKKSISTLIGNEISYRSPESGENHSAITLRDINKDGKQEAIVFYVKNDDTSTVRMCVLTQSGEDWKLASDYPGYGSGVLTVNFDDLNNDNDEEIFVTWFLFDDKSQKTLSIYAADAKSQELEIKPWISEPYNIMAVTDLYGKGDRQILVANSNPTKETDRNTLKLIGVVENEIAIINETILDNRIISLSSISFDLPAGSATPRFYVDARVSDSMNITQVLEWYESERKFVSAINDAEKPDMTLRDNTLFCKDIDNDGIIEIPLQKPLSEVVDGSMSLGYLLEWFEVKNNSLVAETHYVVNLLESYTLAYPDEWKDIVFVRNDLAFRTWNFIEIADDKENLLFSIVACKPEEWESNAIADAVEIIVHNETVYYCTITPAGAEKGIKSEDIKNNFSVNINSQG